MRPIYVVNNFGQFNHLILRIHRDLGIDAVMIPNSHPPERVAEECRGLILGGGPAIERIGSCAAYLRLGLPVLGICLGLHVIAVTFGGAVSPGKTGGYGAVDVDITDHDRILSGYPGRITVWASHADEVAQVPPGFEVLASSRICANEAIANEKDRIFGIQWHPEVSHTVDGSRLYRNFNELTLAS
jgi:GMP synthase (glutamine-hydrolysing)